MSASSSSSYGLYDNYIDSDDSKPSSIDPPKRDHNIPLSLLDPTLAKFAENCRMIEPTQETIDEARELLANEDLRDREWYGRNVHEWCEEQGRAPKLLGFEKLPNDWIMVVMEYLDKDSWVTFSAVNDKSLLVDGIQNALEKLHEYGTVHGDITAFNIMVKPSSTEFNIVALTGEMDGHCKISHQFWTCRETRTTKGCLF